MPLLERIAPNYQFSSLKKIQGHHSVHIDLHRDEASLKHHQPGICFSRGGNTMSAISGTVPFHERLRSLRKAKGLTMREMARRVGVPETTYREWEVGRAIQGEPYVRMSEALGVSLSELLTGQRPDQARLLVEIENMEEGLRQLKNKLNAML